MACFTILAICMVEVTRIGPVEVGWGASVGLGGGAASGFQIRLPIGFTGPAVSTEGKTARSSWLTASVLGCAPFGRLIGLKILVGPLNTGRSEMIAVWARTCCMLIGRIGGPTMTFFQ